MSYSLHEAHKVAADRGPEQQVQEFKHRTDRRRHSDREDEAGTRAVVAAVGCQGDWKRSRKVFSSW